MDEQVDALPADEPVTGEIDEVVEFEADQFEADEPDVDGRDVAGALAVERPEATGDPRVDDAVALLDGLEALPSAERVGVFDDVQRRLHSALGSLDPASAD